MPNEPSSRTPGDDPATAPPLVSIVVRSMGRPELRVALESIARQDYPAIEAIVVDATGGRHPPLPKLHWRPGHALRMVSRQERLLRPMAANAGLEAIRGAWFSFLDDDDTCEPDHVNALMYGVHAHPEALVVYGCGRLLGERGEEQQVFGRPFNRALMHYGPLFYWQASLISARVRDLGCRFDPAMLVCEDRDFLAQIAQYGDFAFLPGVATFNYRPDLGTSGTGHGVNRDIARVARYENLLRAKWAGPGTLHNERVAARCRRGVRAYFAGDLDKARGAFNDALAEYPDDPNALHGRARVALASGALDTALRDAQRALALNPQADEYLATLHEIVLAKGTSGGVDRDPTSGAASSSTSAQPPPSRLALCPCGSGRRYKACHGRLGGVGLSAKVEPTDTDLERTRAALAHGDADVARQWLRTATTAPDASRKRLLAAARLELDLDDADTALSLLARAAALRVDAPAGLMLDECCARLARSDRDASAWSAVHTMITPARGATSQSLRLIVSASDEPRVQQARRLCDVLRDHTDVELVDPRDAAAASADGATLVLFDPDIEWDPAGGASPARIVVRMERDDPVTLLRALARLQQDHPRAGLQFTQPYEGFDATGRHAMPVEYPWIDAALFELPPPAAGGPGAPLAVGRPGPANALDDHPNDPALYRHLMRDGSRIVVPVTPFLQAAFESDPREASPQFLGKDTCLGVALPDIALFRGQPGIRGHADDRVLATMAAARPVVAFASGLGARECIEDGRSGYLVGSEDEALARIARLARDPGLRRAMGLAARETAAACVRKQRDRARAFYRGVSVNEKS